MNTSYRDDIKSLYQRLIDAWNNRDAKGMAELFNELFTKQGIQIGLDGSKAIGRDEVLSHLEPIFKNHPTALFITKVTDIRAIGADTAILQAIAGMIPPGKTDVEPTVNAQQTLVAVRKDNNWQIELFKNTPAQFHGRPELVEQMTDELRLLIK